LEQVSDMLKKVLFRCAMSKWNIDDRNMQKLAQAHKHVSLCLRSNLHNVGDHPPLQITVDLQARIVQTMSLDSI
jgi:hypothetical protein